MGDVECKYCGKKFGAQQGLEQHTAAKHVQSYGQTTIKKKVSIKRILIFSSLPIIVFVGFLLYSYYSSLPGKYDSFAKCLTEKGVAMYGAYWCPRCAEQKQLFGSSFKYVNYVECDPKGNNAKPEACKEKDVKGYPTWIFNNDSKTGVQNILSLSLWSGCSVELKS